jgi:hypothetical protein
LELQDQLQEQQEQRTHLQEEMRQTAFQ